MRNDYFKLCLPLLERSVPTVLANYDSRTGLYLLPGQGQHMYNQAVIHLLTTLYYLEHPKNRWRKKNKLLAAVIGGGDAMARCQNADGTMDCVTPKKNWGPVPMDWNLYYWATTLEALRDELSPEQIRNWSEGIARGASFLLNTRVLPQKRQTDFTSSGLGTGPNHYAWYLLALLRVGQLLNDSGMEREARRQMARFARAQDSDGFWPEIVGPSVDYNLLTLHAVGLFHALSGDRRLAKPLARAARFHQNFSYPDGRAIETGDDRLGLVFVPPIQGLFEMWNQPGGKEYAERVLTSAEHSEKMQNYTKNCYLFLALLADGFLYARRTTGDEKKARVFLRERMRLRNWPWAIWRREPWMVSLSTITSPAVKDSVWVIERQSHISIWHRYVGIVVGGGNSRGDAKFSTFEVQDKSGVEHLAQSGTLRASGRTGVALLTYRGGEGRISWKEDESDSLLLRMVFKPAKNSTKTISHIPLVLSMGSVVGERRGKNHKLSRRRFVIRLRPGKDFLAGGICFHASVPAVFAWPCYPFHVYNQWTPANAKGILSLELSPERICELSIKFAGK